MEAQRFPQDFDGILVGSPANFWTDLMVRFQWDQHALLVDPARATGTTTNDREDGGESEGKGYE
jgi:hypothetical protein